MLVDGSLTNLMQGVSQQPNRDRLPGQCTTQLNMVADIVDGLKRRPPFELISKIMATSPAVKWHSYNTGSEQYLVAFKNGDVDVWDLAGNAQTVNVYNATYITTSTPDDKLSLTTIGDYTIVANKHVVPAMKSTTNAYVHGAVLYFTSGGENEQRYTVYIGGTKYADWTSPSINDTSIPTGAFSVEYAVNQLYTQLAASAAATTYNFTLRRHSILVERKSGTTPIEVTVGDGHAADKTAYVIQDVIRKAEMLPPYGKPGQVVAVVGDGDNETDDLYLKFEVKPGLPNSFGSEGVWRETLKDGIRYMLDEDTMPHALIRLPSGQFYFGPLDGSTQGTLTIEEWVDRKAGNDSTNPIPAFVGQTINFIGTFQERMYILSNDVVNFSATDSYFNFFHKTATAIVDTDPIEYVAPDEKVAVLKYGIQHNKNLVLFTDYSQFLIRGDQALTPANANLPLTTTFEADLTTKPATGGDVVFFPISYGEYAGVQEFYTSSELETNNARAITEHVKRYIKGNLVQMESNVKLGMLLCRSEGAPKSIYLYQYLWQQAERVQSAWSEWTLSGNIKYVFWDSAVLYGVVEWDSELYLLKMDLTDRPITGIDFNIYLDALAKYTPSNRQITLPFQNVDISMLRAVRGANDQYPGMSVKIVDVTGYVVTLADDTGDVWIGVVYPSEYAPSMPKILDYKGRIVSTDRLSLTRFLLTYKDTGHFETLVQHPYYDDAGQIFTGRVAGSAANIVGEQPIESGVFKAAVRRNINDCHFAVRTESYLPLTLTNIEWVGQYTKRGNRI